MPTANATMLWLGLGWSDNMRTIVFFRPNCKFLSGDQSNVIYLQSSNGTSLLVGKEFSRENQFTAAMFFVMVIDSVWRDECN